VTARPQPDGGATVRAAQVLTRTTDVVDETQVEAAVREAVAWFGRIDIVVNCAGVADRRSAWMQGCGRRIESGLQADGLPGVGHRLVIRALRGVSWFAHLMMTATTNRNER